MNARQRILDGTLELLRAEGGGTITLDAAAKQVGLTKPGLMYHFSSKKTLMFAVVDHVTQRWERMLLDALGLPRAEASPRQRIRAYVEVAMNGELDRADFAVCSEAFYQESLGAVWTHRLEPWVTLPDDLPDAERGRLTAARLLADGYWMAAATGVLPVPDRDRKHLLAVVEELVTP